MKAEDIMQALRLTAMGRCGHPLQEELADKLAEVFVYHALTASAVVDQKEPEVTDNALKRGSGRTKKAD